MYGFNMNHTRAKKRRRRTVAAYPQHVYLGDSHVVEVKKGGLHIGIYLITPTSRRRGVVLPLDVWLLLQTSLETVNQAINTSLAIIQNGDNTGDTVTNTQQFTYQIGGNGDCYTIPYNHDNQYFTYGANTDYSNFNTQPNTTVGYTGVPPEAIIATEANVYQTQNGTNIQRSWVSTKPGIYEPTTFYNTANPTTSTQDQGAGFNTRTSSNSYGEGPSFTTTTSSNPYDQGAGWSTTTTGNTDRYHGPPTSSTTDKDNDSNATCSNTQAAINDFFDIFKDIVAEESETQPCQATV
jgi:hypothetical protein